MKKMTMLALAALMLAGSISAASYNPQKVDSSTHPMSQGVSPRPCPLSQPNCAE